MTADLEAWLLQQGIRSWFDLGLMLDGIGDNRDIAGLSINREEVRLRPGRGVALISFEAPGESHRAEVSRYAEVLEYLQAQSGGSGESAIWWVDEEFSADSETLAARRWRDSDVDSREKHVWDGYADIFETTLDRGSSEYNALIGKIWSQTCAIAPRLAAFVAQQDIRMLLPLNVCATPNHVSLTLAIVLVSERLQVPVLSVNNSFWWEDPAYRAEPGAIPDSRGQFFANAHLGEVFSLVEVLFPWDSPLWVHTCRSADQRDRLIAEFGFNPARVALLEQACASQPDAQTVVVFRNLVETLASGLDTRAQQRRRCATVRAFSAHQAATCRDENFHRIALARNREYLPGLNKLEYLCTLKSLIDPSAFRMEEKALRGRVYRHVQAMLERRVPDMALRKAILLNVGDLFFYHEGDDGLVVDHSLSYRHRHRRHYPWRKLTEPELIGCVTAMIEEVVPACDGEVAPVQAGLIPHSAVQALRELAQPEDGQPGIDHGEALEFILAESRPVVWLPGDNWQEEALGWVSALLLQRLGVPPDQADTARLGRQLDHTDIAASQIVLFASRHQGRLEPACAEAQQWLARAPTPLAECHAAGLLRVVETEVLGAGTHLAQLGGAAAELAALRDAGGVVVAVGEANFHTLDTLDMESFRVARCTGQPFASFIGLRPGQGFVLRVPAGMRPSLAYPTPIQTPVEFAHALNSEMFRKAADRLGESALQAVMREDADSNGTPLATLLEKLLGEAGEAGNPNLDCRLLTGVHENGDPWSGATACLFGVADGRWRFHAGFAEQSSDTVLALIDQFRRSGGLPVDVAWNGGFILNPELVGKLGLPEEYIGTPLGLLIDEGRVIAPPLFKKPAMAFLEDGSIQLREASIDDGLSVTGPGGASFRFLPEHCNSSAPDGPAIFDLMYAQTKVPGMGRRLFRLAGDRVLEVVEDSGSVELLPVGLTLALPADQAPDWQAGDRIQYELQGWEGVDKAIEAGPMLVRDGRISVEMEQGGWTLPSSIRTQAARIDFLHMRGPKIGVGLTDAGDLVIAAVNGRVRESVGATHGELAQILLDLGAVQGMGFDPGGSVTLVVQGRQLNISPYNKDYLSSPWSLPPQPRFVGNAILAVTSG